MSRMGRIPLLVKLPLLTVATVLLTAGASSVVAIWIGRGVVRTSVVEENLSDVRVYAHTIMLYLDSARSLLETASGSPGLAGFISGQSGGQAARGLPVASEERERDIAAGRLKYSKVFEYMMLLRPDGSVYFMEPRELQDRLSHTDLSYTAWYKKLLNTGRTTMSDLHISPATQRPTVVIAVPVRRADQRIVGIWAGGIRLDQLSRVGKEEGEQEAPERYSYLTDGRGLVIAHQANAKYVLEQTDFRSVPPVSAALAGQRGAMQFVNPIDGEDLLGAYLPLEEAGWAVVHVTPARLADGPIVSLTRGIMATSLGMAVLLGLAGVGVVRRIVGPLGQVAAAVQAFGRGDLKRRIEVRTGDEIERLAREFNRMATGLSEKEVQLRERADQLEAANKELEAFSYSVSHDLRAPLRAMDGFSRILVEEYGSQIDPEARRYLHIVRDNTKQMGRLVDDLLAFSRLSRQAPQVHPLAPAELARDALKDLRAEQEGRQVDIIFGELPVCQADSALLKQVFFNLLSNALKFTRKREVAVIEIGSTTISDCKLRIADLPDPPIQSAIPNLKSAVYFVRDNGVGFDMQYAHKLFGVFQRLHRSEEYEGTGVGLAIVQRIIHRHGGRVWAEAAVEQGATFYFTI